MTFDEFYLYCLSNDLGFYIGLNEGCDALEVRFRSCSWCEHYFEEDLPKLDDNFSSSLNGVVERFEEIQMLYRQLRELVGNLSPELYSELSADGWLFAASSGWKWNEQKIHDELYDRHSLREFYERCIGLP